jgi:hypothetical protein
VPEGIRVAVEFRHPSWHGEEIFQLLERRGAAYCVMSGSRLPCILRATAPFVYVRLHGPDHEHLYGGSYSDDDLRLYMANCHLSSDWQFKQSVAVALPAVILKAGGLRGWAARFLPGCVAR